MSPGGVTELIHFFAAEYNESLRDNAGGGVEDESIDVLELPGQSGALATGDAGGG
ncbi:hypothetical protein HZD82_27465, partial [Pantoea agglomerans]|nr:hypothetical protein [Pantoea agglomerans]